MTSEDVVGLIDRLHRLDEKVGLGPSAQGIGRQLEEYPAARARWDQLEESRQVEAYLDAAVRSEPPPTERDVSLWLALLEVAQRPVTIILWMDIAVLVATWVMLESGVSSGIVSSALGISVAGVAGAAVLLRRLSKQRRELLRQMAEPR